MSNFQAEIPLAAGPASSRTFFGHPVGLYVLFFTEMWERFSYYGMRALLVLYMINYLSKPEIAAGVLGYGAVRGALEGVFGPLATQAFASQIYGIYTALVYLTPLLGGYLADQVWGQRRTVVIGGVLMAMGHFLMAFESLFFPALGLIILGNGAFKPNISTQVGGLYPPGDPRRDQAFSIFYVGINLGAFAAPLVCGTLGETVGWHYGFSAAGVGMVIGLMIYLFGQRYLAPDQLAQTRANHTEKIPLDSTERSGILALVALCVINVFWWAAYEQSGNTIAFWADKFTNRELFGNGWLFPATWVQSINPFLIFTLTPVIVGLWAWQAGRGKELSTIAKMVFSCMLLGMAFLVMVGGAREYAQTGTTSIWWLLAFFTLLTVSELYLSPIGLSLVTKVAPARMVSLLMGMWFLAIFAGNYLGGFLGTYIERIPKETFFLGMACMCFAAGGAMWLLSGPVKKAVNASIAQKKA
ncbi:MAG: peptide MFS transporter [Aphanocapsa lilacina HA4352-LM1]|jgi:POT family proton-dependent oligopeptide transporter|nr:peptide MFS transporter [Aphanocapsa lilacina HA4352-LM1]